MTETDDVKSFVLVDPTGKPFIFEAGQYFTVAVWIGGRVLRRAYSASSSPSETQSLTLTCKRVSGGLVSSHLHEHVHEGDVLEILGPSGSFTVAEDEAARHVFLAGGSGITPVMSLLRRLLEGNGTSRVHLVYGSRSPKDIIFRGALDALASAFPERFSIQYFVDEGSDSFPHSVGLLGKAALSRALEGLRESANSVFYLCGPEPMMDAAREVLADLDVPSERIRQERFGSPHASPSTMTYEAHTLALRGPEGKERLVRVEPGQTLLEAGIASGAKMPFSCAVGGCASCKCRLLKGSVHMDEPNGLSASEREQGYVLACIAHPTSAVVVEHR